MHRDVARFRRRLSGPGSLTGVSGVLEDQRTRPLFAKFEIRSFENNSGIAVGYYRDTVLGSDAQNLPNLGRREAEIRSKPVGHSSVAALRASSKLPSKPTEAINPGFRLAPS